MYTVSGGSSKKRKHEAVQNDASAPPEAQAPTTKFLDIDFGPEPDKKKSKKDTTKDRKLRQAAKVGSKPDQAHGPPPETIEQDESKITFNEDAEEANGDFNSRVNLEIKNEVAGNVNGATDGENDGERKALLRARREKKKANKILSKQQAEEEGRVWQRPPRVVAQPVPAPPSEHAAEVAPNEEIQPVAASLPAENVEEEADGERIKKRRPHRPHKPHHLSRKDNKLRLQEIKRLETIRLEAEGKPAVEVVAKLLKEPEVVKIEDLRETREARQQHRQDVIDRRLAEEDGARPVVVSSAPVVSHHDEAARKAQVKADKKARKLAKKETQKQAAKQAKEEAKAVSANTSVVPLAGTQDDAVEDTPDVALIRAADAGQSDGDAETQMKLTRTGGKAKAKKPSREERKAQKKMTKEAEEPTTKPTTAVQKTTATNPETPARSRPSWTLSPPSAGAFVDQDPVFVRDLNGEDFLISANDREVQVLSLETSLVVRTHLTPIGETINCFAVEGEQVYIAYSRGSPWIWNWSRDEPARQMIMHASKVLSMALAPPDKEEVSSSLFYISLEGNRTTIYGKGQHLHSTKHQLHTIQVLGSGDYVIAQSQSAVVLGSRSKNTNEYVWIELPFTPGCTCADARIVSTPAGGRKASSARAGLRLAVGGEDGKIQVYDDVSALFRRNEEGGLPTPRILHWHRDAVSSLKFSRDGNYLISGGTETVLVLWQLETGKTQFLPHLTSEIERVVVNAEGDRYAIQMGDNSIMVLNTSELKPVANFAGLQLLRTPEDADVKAHRAPAATLHPRNTNQLLLAVPASQPKMVNEIASRPFLQAFDIRTSRHVTRQALTRNNVTDFNLGPERTPIMPPDVQQLAISYDGSWLATIDFWMPPASDLDSFASDRADMKRQRLSRREIYLKFWRWNDGQGLWTLTTRVDSPHVRDSGEAGAGSVHALVADPAANGFATVGEDGCVRLWKPKTRMRSGVAVKDDANVEVVEWTCKRTFRLETGDDRADSPLATGIKQKRKMTMAHLAYASDGSMLAAAQTTGDHSKTPLVHFIDTAGGDVVTKSGLAATQIIAVGFVDRYFIAVSKPAAYVWDLVEDTLMHKVKLARHEKDSDPKMVMLAVNGGDGTFAIVTDKERVKVYDPQHKKSLYEQMFETQIEAMLAVNGGDGTFAIVTDKERVKVYDPQHKKSLYEQMFETQIEAILAGKGAKGYTLLFADATIRTLSPPASGHGRASRSAPQAALPDSGFAAVEAAPEQEDMEMVDIVSSSQPMADQTRTALVAKSQEDDRPVVRPEQLADIFDVGGVVMPPVKDMFQAIVGLYSRKPIVTLGVEVGA